MLKSRRLLRGEITYDSAKEQDANILHQSGYRDQRTTYFTHLCRSRRLIQKIVGHHLGLHSLDICHVVDVEEWIHGSFNVCIRIDVDAQGHNPARQLMIRFPLPYRIGESSCPGNADEKVRCEAGTYAWLQENCPTVPIPQLYGFGLSTGRTSNILVDDNWNIKCLIDLEWACSHAAEMIQPPYWLSNQAIDLINKDDYEMLHRELMETFADEEMKIKPPVLLHSILQQGWVRGTFWYSLALSSPTALFKIFYDHIQPRFSRSHRDDELLSDHHAVLDI
ncbi:hypothetical protein AJ79_00507 [Helicocarpus griseus UAMH5409]|uniref:Aminoglycoside phosphotransferase domain-containing protein n=1 Tax=Helicocarpus griseus UAMH5409 TaxID=1447875 RepID=A0A2B7YC12_9EURO|nr:hypothetical protein AJ79_00507 [Helicocarpus griseus UAMH5409]